MIPAFPKSAPGGGPATVAPTEPVAAPAAAAPTSTIGAPPPTPKMAAAAPAALPSLGGAAPATVLTAPVGPVSKKPPPLIVFHGEPKLGKTTLMGKVLQGALYIQSKDDVTTPIISLCEAFPGKFVPPRRIITIGEAGTSELTGEPMGTWAALCWIINAAQAGALENYPSIVFDETNTFLDRVFNEMKASGLFVGRSGKPDEFAVYRGISDFTRAWMALPGQTGKAVGFVAHTGNAVNYEEGPLAGKLKSKAGPKSPSGAVTRQIAADATFNFRLTLVPKGGIPGSEVYSRVALTGAHPLYEQGCRDARIPSVIDLESVDLHQYLTDLGWPIGP